MSNAFDLDRIGGRRAFDALVTEVIAAGEYALSLQKNGVGGRALRKPDNSPVTEADEAVEKRLRAFLLEHFEGVGFLGEETGSQPGDGAMRFVVDPIDGTRAFTRGFDTWSVLVGLEADGEPVAGIAFMPAAGDLMVAVNGDGAHLNGKRVTVSEVSTLEDAIISHGGLHQFSEQGMADILKKLGELTFAQRGHVDFDGYRQILSGKLEAMVDPGIKPWDVCPAAVLIREAGGRVTDFSGAETIHGGTFLATNGLVHDALLEILQ